MLKPYNKAEITFDIVKEIGGDGRNSKTYVSYDHQLNAEIVTKQVAKSTLRSTSNFFDESRMLYASAHPNVVQIHYACEDADHIYLAMPYYQKGSLKSLITGQHMTVREIIAAACQVLSGLHNIHSKGLIHFDIKPDNILLSNRGEAMLSDFGLAKQTNFAGVAAQDRLYGKMMPPEAFSTDHFDNTFDIFQFGMTLYRMCNGNSAFYEQFANYTSSGVLDRDSFRFAVCNGRFPDRGTFPGHIPRALRNIIRKCIQPAPGGRYQSAIAVANALAGIEGDALDWRLTEEPDRRIWQKNKEGTEYEFTVERNGACTCYRSANGGPRRRFVAWCKGSVSEREIQSFLGSY